MAALTATDWTVVVEQKLIEGQRKRNRCKLTLATAGAYPSNGIPLPANGKLGMVRNLEYVVVTDPVAARTAPVKYDQANNTFRVFIATATAGPHLTESATTVTNGAGADFVVYIEAVGW